MSQKISTFLWFDQQAEQAAEFYVSVFRDGRITGVQRYSEAGPGEAGSVMLVSFELFGQEYRALNGGPMFRFNEAVSLQVDCEDQAEVDRYWEQLTADGGEPGPCGWLKDRFGLSWQIVPRRMIELLADSDPARARRATEAMLKMGKLDVAALEAAADGD
ncbi:VOC family protein [Kitasatospora cheerisanensis]|uniref:3-demethylubiquinone-9 3-methyltransferase n=1 Tax=Kitasatospora cheerisanensis KCTC 2395 TaxID=1348663 RepID=A0A066YUP0_9ACTN|nr:VOC family protein [Kitasatospora cheerisanensis]KDN81645.1 3-demethylubiquinone-9 3-methyltransferase [Kitasatospora cheerisanensis KCTC 2395]